MQSDLEDWCSKDVGCLGWQYVLCIGMQVQSGEDECSWLCHWRWWGIWAIPRTLTPRASDSTFLYDSISGSSDCDSLAPISKHHFRSSQDYSSSLCTSEYCLKVALIPRLGLRPSIVGSRQVLVLIAWLAWVSQPWKKQATATHHIQVSSIPRCRGGHF